jgi:hypothetical protein
MDGGLAWLGFGSSRGFRDHIVGCRVVKIIFIYQMFIS